MKTIMKICLAAGALFVPLAAADDAEAREFCREYQKSIIVNGRPERGYGTACKQEDGSWLIVSAEGNVDPFDALRARKVEIVAAHRPVYFSYGPRMRPVYYKVCDSRAYYHDHTPWFIYSDYGRPGWRGRHHWKRHHDWEDRHDGRGHDDDRDGRRGRSENHRRD